MWDHAWNHSDVCGDALEGYPQCYGCYVALIVVVVIVMVLIQFVGIVLVVGIVVLVVVGVVGVLKLGFVLDSFVLCLFLGRI